MTRVDALWLAWLGAFVALEAYALLRVPESALSAVVWRLTRGPVARLALGVLLGLVCAHLLAQEAYEGRP